MKRFQKKQAIRRAAHRGFTLLFGVLVTGLLMATVLTIAAIVVKQIMLSGVGRESQVAFYAADSILECVKYHDRDGRFASVDDAADTLVCNGQEFDLDQDELTDNFTCSPNTAYYCPELVDGVTEVFGKFVYSSNQIVAGTNVPEADFVVLKRLGPENGPNGESYADGQTTITINGRNTENEQTTRRVERTLQETYLPSACANPAGTQVFQNGNDAVTLKAVRVRCSSEDDLPDDWTNWYEDGATWTFPWSGSSAPLTSSNIQDFLEDNPGCTIDPGACFEYSIAEEEGDADENYNEIIDGVHEDNYFTLQGQPYGNETGPAGEAGDVTWIPFASASGNSLDTPAQVYVRPSDDEHYIAKLRVRAVLEPGQYPFSKPCGSASHPCPSSDPDDPDYALSSQFICHEDGNEFDPIDYVGRRIANPPQNRRQFYIPQIGLTYFCAMFTAPKN